MRRARPESISKRHKSMCCPFCETKIARPQPMGDNPLYVFEGGQCKGCGAVYALDASGREGGQAYLSALSHACGDIEKACQLQAGMDYRQEMIAYNSKTHEADNQQFRQRYGVARLIFVQLSAGGTADAPLGETGLK